MTSWPGLSARHLVGALLFLGNACDDGNDGLGSVGAGELCGGFAGTQCDQGLYCDYATNSCGEADEGGTCRAPAPSCPEVIVCGCDGQQYNSPCAAAAAGVDVSDDNSCN